MGSRWYDPERCGYISSASPEMLLQNASVVFGLNLYGFITNNPVNIALDCGSIYPSLDFYFNGAYASWWDKYKNWVLFGIGVVATNRALLIFFRK